MASQTGMIKTDYPGVYYRLTKRIGGKGTEKVFYFTFKKDGKKVWEKAGREHADDMTPARASTKRGLRIEGKTPSPKEERERKKAEKLAEAGKWTIQKLWDEYEKQKEDNKAFKTDKGRYELYLKEPFGGKEPEKILQLDVDRVRVKLRKKKSPQTVKHVLALLKRVIKFGTDRGLCAPLGFAINLPRVDNRKTEFLAADEIKRLLEAIEKDTHPQAGPMMLMALYTGMRRGELFKLQWRDIDTENGFITIREPKGGKSQKIPLNDGARAVLNKLHRGKSPYVFAGREGKQRVDINKALNAIKTAAKLPAGFRPLHGLRHHFASMLASSGAVDLYTLQKLLTHKDHRMTERYAHLHDDTLKRASNLAGSIIQKAARKKKKVVNIKKK